MYLSSDNLELRITTAWSNFRVAIKKKSEIQCELQAQDEATSKRKKKSMDRIGMEEPVEDTLQKRECSLPQILKMPTANQLRD